MKAVGLLNYQCWIQQEHVHRVLGAKNEEGNISELYEDQENEFTGF